MRRIALLALPALLLPALLPAPRGAWAGDPSPRERFLRDGDAKALAAALSTSRDPADREETLLARLAAGESADDPVAMAPGPVFLAVLALRGESAAGPEGARLAADAGQRGGVSGAWVEALLRARGGDDPGAVARLLAPPSPSAADEFSLALLGAALPADDRPVVAALARYASIRAAQEGRAALGAALAEGAALLDPASAGRSLTASSRALRRAGRPADALSLLLGSAALRAGLSAPALRLERALSRWRMGDAKGARGEAAAVSSPAEFSWAFEALSRAAAAPPGGAPARPAAAGENLDAWALAALATALGMPARGEDVLARAKSPAATAAGLAFGRSWLAEAGLSSAELAADEGQATALLQNGLPLVAWRVRRRGERFKDVPVLVRSYDAATGLCVVDDPDADAPDAMPASWLSKSRALVAVPAARSAELDAVRASPAGRLGATLAEGLSALESTTPGAAAPKILSHAAEFPGRTAVDLYAGYAAYAVAIEAGDAAGLSRWTAALRRSAATPPVLAPERFVQSEAALAAENLAASLLALDEAARAEGAARYLYEARFLATSASGHAREALEAIDAAVALDPLDPRVRRYRASLRATLGDAAGARADLRRVLNRQPGDLAAAEGLSALWLAACEPARALEAALAAERATASGADAPAGRDLRRQVEVAALRAAKRPEDLVPLAKSADAEVRAGVAGAAAALDGPAAEDLLRVLLLDPDEVVRRRAALGHGTPPLLARAEADASVLARLLGPLASDLSPAVREALVQVVSLLRAPAAVSALSARLAGASRDPVPSVRSVVAEAVGARDTPVARRALVSALADEEPAVRQAAIRVLSRWTGTDRGFQPDDTAEKRAAAARAWEDWIRAGPK